MPPRPSHPGATAPPRRAALRRALRALPPAALAVAFSGCSDDRRGVDALTGPGRAPLARSADSTAALGAPVASFSGTVDPAAPLAHVRCTVIVGPTPGLSCASSTMGGYRVEGSRLVMGGHGSFVAVSGGGGSFKDGALLVNAVVRNLIYQALGTADGASPHADGVRLVLVGAPVVTGGTGSVSAVGDGVATVTAPDQPYWQFNTVLDELELSAPKALTFQLTGAVTSYTVDLVVAAAVQHPSGRMTLTPTNATLASGQQQQLLAAARDAVGSPVAADQTTWTSADPLLATVGADGLVSALRAGTVAITATSGARAGTAQVTVTPIARTWTGAVSTNWEEPGNWAGGIVPVAKDTAVIPAGPQGPALVQNTEIGGLAIAEKATVALGVYNLTASGDVVAGGLSGGGITGSTGVTVLAGTARTVSGNVTRPRVTGTYSLSGNLVVTNALRVDGGRLTDGAFQIRVNGW